MVNSTARQPRTPRILRLGPAAPARGRTRPVDVWLADATRQPDLVEDLGRRVLDAAERDRADTLLRPADRRCYLTAHVALRVLLGARLGVAADRVRFRREPCPCCGEPHGRPAPAGTGVPLHFSLSHSGDLALIAFASTPVGIDVQTVGTVAAADEHEGVLHPREEDELDACAAADRPAAFARAWVRKEAYLKGLGTGLARSPSLDYLGSGAAAAGPPGWHIEDLAVPDGYAGAVALREETGRAARPA
ncbi:4'-phosphopantetheinyl transferase superfamily protein [Streptomyces sp. NBC_00249]|uniref:4'-phosphopantetheinyl transferase family protein n=1 Tax=Streptomyces sp. NBC_00249 TaxID=2975690 RepID=UPI0022526D95|nr:4'-phosphopantetheinyl transferase superfamily protein [Streptomyces sp. NBC_00249]MCX5199536.1 4'-phosphopantetheinyl transferase superfamily protein [Streptomyces sp. NBC_00249]